MKKILIISGSILGGLLLIFAILIGIGYHKYMSIQSEALDPQLTVYQGGGGNALVLTSKDGEKALVIDTKMGSAADKMRKKISARDIVVVNTHAHMDHTGGNKLYPGAQVIAGAYSKEEWAKFGAKLRYPDETVKAGEEKTVQIDDETAHIRNWGATHTSNGIVVYFEKRKLLAAGDIVFVNMHPVISPANGTDVKRWVALLDSIYTIYDIRKLIPGHGPVSGKEALRDMSNYFTSIRDAIGNEALLEDLRKKYQGYYALPGMSSFDITVKVIGEELRK
jgi:glyoxylase-like metal-dependent hydrolase (beta-lactamase superfamily II)